MFNTAKSDHRQKDDVLQQHIAQPLLPRSD